MRFEVHQCVRCSHTVTVRALQGCRIPEPSPLKTPGAGNANLASSALRPTANAALHGLSAERLTSSFEQAPPAQRVFQAPAQAQVPDASAATSSGAGGSGAAAGAAAGGRAPRPHTHRRKAPPERLPIGLMQYRSWLMRGCEGNPQGLSLNGPGLALGDDGLPMGDQEKCLRHCLTLRTRRWAMFEFMTPKIDEPWYHQGSMRQLLDSMGLQGLRNMTRADMRFLRLALGGRPRRLSPAFLHGERCSLVQHREKCREFYGQLAHDPTLPYPPDVPEQIAVGQSVTARHPRLRTLHDGDVLTASVSTYMVQFHRAELSVAKVADIDVGDACDGALAPVTAASAAAAAQAGMPGGADGGSTGRSDIVRSLVDTSLLLSCCRFLAQAFQVPQSH